MRQLTGVRVVDNLITVQPKTELTPTDVERRVQAAIVQTADLHARSIRVTVNDTTVHLDGRLQSAGALHAALRAAETAPGVTAVESEIVVTPD